MGLLPALRILNRVNDRGEAPEVPRFERSRGPGSTAEVDFWTSREVREVVHSHLNYIVADTKKREESAAYLLDTHPQVDAFVKKAGLGLAIHYLHNGQPHGLRPRLPRPPERRSRAANDPGDQGL